ncbi:MAG TPA: hypothetical protein VF157_15620 [Chloroflexota bacterium]
MTDSGLVLVHHDAPADLDFRRWLEQEYFPAIMPLMGVKRVTRLRSTSPEGLLRPYLTVLHTDDVRRTVEATSDAAWRELASEAVKRGVSQREIVPYRQLFELEAVAQPIPERGML